MLRTGSLGLDILLKGGWKPGTVNEIWGEPGSGKSTLAEHAVWSLQDGKSLWMSLGQDRPHRSLGPQAMVCQPRNAEQAFWIMDTCVRGDVALIVVDSANGLVRQAEIDGDPDYVPHPQREYKDELNGLKVGCKSSGAIVLFLSKPRDRDRQPVRGTGISEKAKDRVELRIAHQYQDDTRDIKVTVKGADDHTSIRMEPGLGIDWSLELAHLAVRYEVVEKIGNWYETGHARFHGIKALAEAIEDDSRYAGYVEDAVRNLAEIA